jgi:hypothetical protein
LKGLDVIRRKWRAQTCILARALAKQSELPWLMPRIRIRTGFRTNKFYMTVNIPESRYRLLSRGLA